VQRDDEMHLLAPHPKKLWLPAFPPPCSLKKSHP
jgi:hypothetical protein